MLKFLNALLLTLLCVAAQAQQASGPAQPDASGHADVFYGLLLPAPVATAESELPATFTNFPTHQGRTGTLLLLPEPIDANIPLALVGSYAELQKILQQRDFLFWQLPLWTVIVNLTSALVLLLVSLKQSDLPLFRWLLACALTGNFYFLPQLAPQLSPYWISLPGVVIWLFLLFKLMQASRQWQMNTAGFRPDRASQMLRYAVLLLMTLFVADGLIVLMDVTFPDHPGMHPQLVPVGQLLGILAALYFLVSRHAETGMALENLNTSLDQRVKSARIELQERYAQLKKDALDAAGMKERKTIYHSIHEDLSDKLLQLIYSASVPETADLARSALSELRDSRNLLPDQQRPLDDVLADARSEIQTRCDQAAIALNWQQSHSDFPVLLNARQCSALSRTLREAISNLLKHAKAKSAHVDISVLHDSVLMYRITDNGIGLVNATKPGRGLINMQNRIRELGGALSIGNAESGGVQLEFRLPLKNAQAEQGDGV